MAKLLSAKDYTPTELKQEIISTWANHWHNLNGIIIIIMMFEKTSFCSATHDKVEGITDPDTPNLLLFKNCAA